MEFLLNKRARTCDVTNLKKIKNKKLRLEGRNTEDFQSSIRFGNNKKLN
jgi:hypothetical protein